MTDWDRKFFRSASVVRVCIFGLQADLCTFRTEAPVIQTGPARECLQTTEHEWAEKRTKKQPNSCDTPVQGYAAALGESIAPIVAVGYFLEAMRNGSSKNKQGSSLDFLLSFLFPLILGTSA